LFPQNVIVKRWIASLVISCTKEALELGLLLIRYSPILQAYL